MSFERSHLRLKYKRIRQSYAWVIEPLQQLSAIAVLILFWHFSIPLFNINSAIFPQPVEVVEAIFDNQSELLAETMVTLKGVAGGLLIGSIIGFIVGLFSFYSSVFKNTVYPPLIGVGIAPKIAFAPIIVLWLGSGLNSAVALAALIVFFPVLVNTYDGFQNINRDIIMMAESFGASKWFLFWRVRIPNATPHLMIGAKLGVVFAFIGAVVAEFIASGSGMGYLITSYTTYGQTASAFAGVVVITLVSLVGYLIVDLIDRKYFVWYENN